MPGIEKSQKVEDRVSPLLELTGYGHMSEQVTARSRGVCPLTQAIQATERAAADSLRNDVEIRDTVKDGD